MNMHKNAPLTPRGRERIARQVDDERIVRWVNSSLMNFLDGNGRVKFQTGGTTKGLPSENG
jgi:hypothetical protein